MASKTNTEGCEKPEFSPVANGVRSLSINEALDAIAHAEFIVNGCESIDELDEASNYHVAMDGCPDSFTQAQKQLAQEVILNAFMRSIGRA